VFQELNWFIVCFSEEKTDGVLENTENLPLGSKLKVRYGHGDNTSEYEAKVGDNYNNSNFRKVI